jgi:WD40 repeat protein
MNKKLRAFPSLLLPLVLLACASRSRQISPSPAGGLPVSPPLSPPMTITPVATKWPTRTSFPQPPAGAYIAFTAATGVQADTPIRTLFLRDMSTGDQYTLARDIFAGSVSPDGSVALLSKADGLYALNLATGSEDPVYRYEADLQLYPPHCSTFQWSRSAKLAATVCGAPFEQYSLVTFRTSGSKLRSVPLAMDCFAPNLSSDGSLVLATCFDPDRGDVVAYIPTDGTSLTAIPCPPGLICNRPRLSPDGLHLSFFSGEGRSGEPSEQWGVFVGEAACLSQSTVCDSLTTVHVAQTEHWTWSPDGSQLAFIQGEMEVAIYNLKGRTTRVVGGTRPSVWAMQWAPNGEWIAVVTESGISVFSPDGASRETIASGDLIELVGWVTVSSAN